MSEDKPVGPSECVIMPVEQVQQLVERAVREALNADDLLLVEAFAEVLGDRVASRLRRSGALPSDAGELGPDDVVQAIAELVDEWRAVLPPMLRKLADEIEGGATPRRGRSNDER